MGLLKLVICAAMLGCSQAFVAPASSLVVRPRADAVSANMLFGTKKPTITKGKVQHGKSSSSPSMQPCSNSNNSNTPPKSNKA